MAELADALDLGSSAREGVGVQVSPGARRISEMRTRFSDLVFSYWGNLAATAAASRAVYGRPTHRSHQSHCLWSAPTYQPRLAHPALALPCSHLRTLAPCRALPTCPAPVSPAAPALSAPANLYSTTPFLNAQITSCTRLCVPVFAIADDRWVFTVDGSKNRVAAISLLLIP